MDQNRDMEAARQRYRSDCEQLLNAERGRQLTTLKGRVDAALDVAERHVVALKRASDILRKHPEINELMDILKHAGL